MPKLMLQWQLHGQPHDHPLSDDAQVTIGRHEECDIVLSLPTVSRRHARIYSEDDKWFVRNLSRTNSVRINQEKRLGYDEVAPLKIGDILKLGPVEIFVIPDLRGRGAKIRCSNCRRISDYNPAGFCPWCGTALAAGETLLGIE